MIEGKKTPLIKYKPTKMGKISLIISIVSLCLGLLVLILSGLSILSAYFIIVSLGFNLIAVISLVFFLCDFYRFKKIYNPNRASSFTKENALYLAIGIIIGIVYGKLL